MKQIEQTEQIEQINPNKIESLNNTLYIEETPETFEQVQVEGEFVDGLYSPVGGYKLYKLFVGDFEEDQTGMHDIINELQKGKPNDLLELHISSYGGDITELLNLYNIVNSMYKNNCDTFLNFGYSAGAIAFLLGANRTVFEHSNWMIHSYSGLIGGKRDDMLTYMNHQDQRLTNFFQKMLSPYFTKKEIKKISKGKDIWLDSEEMIERGIATGIIVEGEYYEREEYLDVLHPERVKKREKKAKKLEKATKKDQKDQKDQKDEK